MNTTTQRETPARADTSSLNPDALKHLSTAAENRSEKTMTNISKEATENLKSKVKGQIVLPSDPSYDEVREIWNAMIERRPALIVRCAEANDVPHAISLTEEESDRVAAAYGANYDCLAQIKRQYDPDNLFHLNQNIKPSPRQG